MKLVLIYLRIKSKQPVILMGETGVGKTSLVEYLAKLMDAFYIKRILHAGINESFIIDEVK